MTKQEIIAAITAKIEGQGTNVDAGGGLAPILKAIIDLIPAPAPAQEQSDWNEADTESPAYIKNKPTIPAPYSLPTASAETLGGVKVGENLSIDPSTGVLSAQGGGGGLIFEGYIDAAEVSTARQEDEQAARTAYQNGIPVSIKDGIHIVSAVCFVEDVLYFMDYNRATSTLLLKPLA